MNVARTTVQGIYAEARKKIAQSLVDGKILLIEGGNTGFVMNLKMYADEVVIGADVDGKVMIIKTLVENTSLSKDFGSEHGLSLYIETKDSKILFDVGASELFLENAKKLNVDISNVDYLIISHGHYDHGGGLRGFLCKNTKLRYFFAHWHLRNTMLCV